MHSSRVLAGFLLERMNERDYLEYVPAPTKPEGFDRQLADIVGLNPMTQRPWIRFVWGCDRMEDYTLPGEDPSCRYPDPDGKCVGLPFWVIEGWQTPEVLNREEWKQGEALLGPFPEQGTWDFIETLRTADYKFIPLGTEALERARSWRFWKNKPKSVAVGDLLHRLELRRQLKDSRKVAAAQKIWDDFQDDYIRAYEKKDKNPVSSLPIPKGEKRTPAGLIVKSYD